jgi:hypothetical protein
LQAWAAANAWSLRRYLAIALLLRLPAILFADGYEYLDEQFQYVDPAWHLASGMAWHRTWEWIDGIRSWVYPGALAGVFWLLSALGIDGAMTTMVAVRALHAVLSLLPLAMFWLLLVRWRPVGNPRLPLLLFAVSGLMVVGVHPSGPSVAATLAVAAGIAMHGPGRAPAFAGLCLGFAFCGRFQDALYGPAFFAVLLAQQRLRAAVWFAVGCVPGIVTQGFVDLAATGTFLGTVWRYVHSNVGLGAAQKWHTHPWWFYWLAGVVPVLALVPLVLGVAWQRLRTGAAVLPGALAGACLHLAAHSCIARKALRFEYSAFALLLAVVCAGLASAQGRRATWHTRLLCAVHLGLFGWVSFWFGNAGSVRTAHWLAAQPQFTGEALVVDGDATSLGGFYYLRVASGGDRVCGVERDALAGRLGTQPPTAGSYVIAVREPLEALAAALPGKLERVASFTGVFDLRGSDRRFVYRWRP